MDTINKNLETLFKSTNKEDDIYLDVGASAVDHDRLICTNRGKLNPIDIKIYTKKIGQMVFTVDTSNVPNKLKEFLENHEFITIYSDYIIKVLMTYDIKVKIKHDLALMESVAISLGREKIKTNTLCMRILAELFDGYKDIIENDLYKKLINIKKMLAYGDYFGIEADISKDVAKFNIKRLNQTALDIECKLREDLNVDIESIEDLTNYVNTMSEISLGTTLKQRIALLENIRTIDKVYMSNYIDIKQKLETLSAECKYNHKIKIYNNRIYVAVRDNRSLLSTDVINNTIKTNPSKHYYISVEPTYTAFRIAEKLKNDIDFGSYDYHSIIASKLFNKQIKEVTPSERKIAKAFNFSRCWGKSYENAISLYKNTAYISTVEAKEQYKKYTDILGDLRCNALNVRLELLIECIYRMSKKLGQLNDFSMTFHHIEHDTVVFKVSNKINPYKAMKIILDCFDCTDDIGIRLFDLISLGNSYRELYENSKYTSNKETGALNYKLTIADIENGYKNNKDKQYRNIVKDVYSENKHI